MSSLILNGTVYGKGWDISKLISIGKKLKNSISTNSIEDCKGVVIHYFFS
jgi:hypothetical protein